MHFQIFPWRETARSSSAPPVLLSCRIIATPRKKRKKAAANLTACPADSADDAALRDFAAQAREERWVAWAEYLL